MAEEYSTWVGLVYVFNLIVGTGALTLPAVFASSGWLMSTILIILLAFFSYVTATFVIESMSCANATLRWKQVETHRIDESEVSVDTDSDLETVTEETAVINRGRQRYYSLNNQVELGQMSKLFFNNWGRLFFYSSLCIYLYGDLAIYTTAVATTFVQLACEPGNSSENYSVNCTSSVAVTKLVLYRGFVGVFILLIGPFAYFNLQKTKYLQIFTTVLRWFSFGVMIILACVRLTGSQEKGHPSLVNISNLPGLIGSSIYSFMCHHSLPGLIAPIKQKSNVIRLVGFDYVAICSFYMLLSLTGSFAFKNLESLYTSNFITYHEGVFNDIVAYFLGAFPIFTLSTSFPIIAITLRNNLKALFLDADSYIEGNNFFLQRLLFPTLAIVPPVIVSLITHNLKSLVSLTGSYAGVMIQYVVPACLVFYGRKSCRREIGSVRNQYESPFKHSGWVVLVLVWCCVCLVFVTVDFTINGIK